MARSDQGSAGRHEDRPRRGPALRAGEVATQREHIAWEGDVLFALAARLLGPDEDRQVLRTFRALDDLWGSSVGDAAARLCAWLDQHASTVLA